MLSAGASIYFNAVSARYKKDATDIGVKYQNETVSSKAIQYWSDYEAAALQADKYSGYSNIFVGIAGATGSISVLLFVIRF